GKQQEQTYSAPFALTLYTQSIIQISNGKEIRTYPSLNILSDNIQQNTQKYLNIAKKIITGLLEGLLSFLILVSLWLSLYSFMNKTSIKSFIHSIVRDQAKVAWREIIMTAGIIWILICISAHLATHYHIFGTSKIG